MPFLTLITTFFGSTLGKAIGVSLLVVSLLTGAFTYGYFKGNAHAGTTITQYKDRVITKTVAAQATIATANEKTVVQYVQDTSALDAMTKKYDALVAALPPTTYIFPDSWVFIHNAATTGAQVDPKTYDNLPSGVDPSIALDTITSNYGVCLKNTDQLSKLQAEILTYQTAVAKANKGN